MSDRLAKYLGLAAFCAQVVLVGCSSSNGAAGTGGQSAVGGTTNPGTGGSTGAGGAAAVKTGDMCSSGVKNKGACTTEPACWNTCGPNKSGFKNCTCAAMSWACPVCSFDPAGDYSCYKIPANIAACPADTSDPVGMLPASGGPCTQAPCKPCGSGTTTAYRDSGGAPKVGYCVCVPPVDPDAGTMGKYSCASIQEWAPQ